MMHIEQRQGSTGFAAAAAIALYGFTVDLKYRAPIHLAGIVMCFGLVTAHIIHIVTPNRFVTKHGKLLALSFGPLFFAFGIINVIAFGAARGAMLR